MHGFNYDFAAAPEALRLGVTRLEAEAPGSLAELQAQLPHGVAAAEVLAMLASDLPPIIAVSWKPEEGMNQLQSVVHEVRLRIGQAGTGEAALARKLAKHAHAQAEAIDQLGDEVAAAFARKGPKVARGAQKNKALEV